jgi:hypothetical protein
MRPKLTYANVTSTLCLFLLLGGGAAYAASHLGKNSVGTKQLKNNAVTTVKIKNQAVTAAKVKNGALTGKQIDASTLGTVPNAAHAASADNAGQLGGAPPGAYESRAQWALVNEKGAILAQSGGITVNAALAGGGLYFLDFGRSIANRPVSVTPHYGDPGLTAEASATPCGGAAVPGGWECLHIETPGVNDARHLFVEMHNSTGADTPFGFYVVVGG